MSTQLVTTSVETSLVTGEELFQLGDIGSCELIDGRIIYMNPPGVEHGRIEIRLARYLDVFVDEHDLGWVVGGETGIYIRRNPDTVRGMDIAVISKKRLPTVPGTGYLTVAPELVVEIVSPSDRWQDIEDKVSDYFSAGVERVWVVHPGQQAVYIYRSLTERTRLGRDETLEGEGVLAGFRLPIKALF
ncbi:MAG: Uma2 family endonuclease [Chloroflexaceae bacterium]|nr:Uma2 family endonuclease [Chloroflexaceae bacterium]